MRDITYKRKTLRKATATSTIVVGPDALEAIENDDVPKGDPYRIAETAALAGVKKTPELIPHCHSIRVENMNVEFERDGNTITVKVTAEATEETGMEMEAMTAASIAALNLYDLLKPVEDDIEIQSVELVSKSGGYSDFQDTAIREQWDLTGAVLVASDSTYEGEREDTSGRILRERLESEDINIDDYAVLPDESDQLRDQLIGWCDRDLDVIATTGGTGPGPRDVTADVTAEILDREVPGIAEAMRSYGQERTPYAMMSRGLAGQRNGTLIINFPGSSNGVREGLDAIFPGLHHYFMMRDKKSGGHGESNS